MVELQLVMGESGRPIAQLTGTDGNVFALIGLAQAYLREVGRHDEATALSKVILEARDYNQALALMIKALESAGFEVT